jgi:hypothetical protein
MTLSERVATGEVSAELDEAIAKVIGWTCASDPDGMPHFLAWSNRAYLSRVLCPSYRTDIRLTLAEIERQGWLSSHTATRNDGCEFDVFNGEWCQTSERLDRNLDLAALEALLKAMGE